MVSQPCSRLLVISFMVSQPCLRLLLISFMVSQPCLRLLVISFMVSQPRLRLLVNSFICQLKNHQIFLFILHFVYILSFYTKPEKGFKKRKKTLKLKFQFLRNEIHVFLNSYFFTFLSQILHPSYKRLLWPHGLLLRG